VAVGLVGFGRFGKFIADRIAEESDVFVFDSVRGIRTTSTRIHSAPLHIVASQSIVLLAVPVSALRTTLRSIRTFVQPSSLIVDVCAVKTKPVEWMKALLPKHVQILGTHPLFGPDSARESLAGHRIYLTPVRISAARLRHVIREMKAQGLLVEILGASKHDKLMAETLLLTQFIGRYVARADLPRHENSTKSYHDLMRIVNIAESDTRELFHDMVRYNPYAKKSIAKLDRAQRKLKIELAD
jgi:prephenate dehydrogenase